MIFEGGITSPVVAETVVSATLNSFWYPFRSISGSMNPPTLETAAAADPEIEPNSMHVSVLT